MGSYYIANDIKFLRGIANLVSTPLCATHIKAKDAHRYVAIHPDCAAIPVGSKQKYILSIRPSFLAPNGTFVKLMSKAKKFKSVEDAYDSLDSLTVSEPMFVIDENYKRQNRPVLVPVKSEPIAVDAKKMPRIRLSKTVRSSVICKTNICEICGRPITEGDFSIDHKLPISRGGSNDIDNLRPVHDACNQLKGNMTDEELMNLVTDITCYKLISYPVEDMNNKIIRCIVRNTLKMYNRE